MGTHLRKLGLPLFAREVDGKGQLILEFLASSIFQENYANIWWISALESKNWLNQTIKGPVS